MDSSRRILEVSNCGAGAAPGTCLDGIFCSANHASTRTRPTTTKVVRKNRSVEKVSISAPGPRRRPGVRPERADPSRASADARRGGDCPQGRWNVALWAWHVLPLPGCGTAREPTEIGRAHV